MDNEEWRLEYLNEIRNGVESRVAKLVGEFQKLLVTRTLNKLKKLGSPFSAILFICIIDEVAVSNKNVEDGRW